jgi:hypothetical protein
MISCMNRINSWNNRSFQFQLRVETFDIPCNWEKTLYSSQICFWILQILCETRQGSSWFNVVKHTNKLIEHKFFLRLSKYDVASKWERKKGNKKNISREWNCILYCEVYRFDFDWKKYFESERTENFMLFYSHSDL